MLKLGPKIFVIALWSAVWSATAAQAQGPTQPGSATTARLNITLEQKHVIKELIKDLKLEPSPTTSVRSAGDPITDSAALRPVPPEIGEKVPQIKAHRFIYNAERILIVDPKDNRVAEIIELE